MTFPFFRSILIVVLLGPAAYVRAQEPPTDAIFEEPALVLPERPEPEPERAETQAERDRRLIEKHLPPVDRELLNRITLPIVGEPNAVRARRIEREQEIQRFRDRMEPVLAGLRRSDPAEFRRVREAYHETLYRLYRELRGD